MKTKNIIIIVTLAIIAVLIWILSGCTHKSGPNGTNAQKDSVVSIIEGFTNPQFDNVVGFTNYANTEKQYNEFIETVSKMHPNTIGAIASSAIQKHKTCDWKMFMNEYHSDKTLYDNVDLAAKKLYPERAKIPLRESDTIDLNKTNVEP